MYKIYIGNSIGWFHALEMTVIENQLTLLLRLGPQTRLKTSIYKEPCSSAKRSMTEGLTITHIWKWDHLFLPIFYSCGAWWLWVSVKAFAMLLLAEEHFPFTNCLDFSLFHHDNLLMDKWSIIILYFQILE